MKIPGNVKIPSLCSQKGAERRDNLWTLLCPTALLPEASQPGKAPRRPNGSVRWVEPTGTGLWLWKGDLAGKIYIQNQTKNKDLSLFVIFTYCICFYSVRCTLTPYQIQLTRMLFLKEPTTFELQRQIFDCLCKHRITEVNTHFSHAPLALLAVVLQWCRLPVTSMCVFSPGLQWTAFKLQVISQKLHFVLLKKTWP